MLTKNSKPIILNGLNSLLFVEISLERGKDDPQRIFESLNSTGLELSQADLIRNYIGSLLRDNSKSLKGGSHRKLFFFAPKSPILLGSG